MAHPVATLLLRQWFLVGMVAVLALAAFGPPLVSGAWTSWAKLGLVAAIFLCSGLSMRTRELGHGLGHWRLHVFVQGFSLVATVLVCWGLDLLWARLGLDPALRLGLLVLGALPTTITSSVAFSAAARGNQAGALVNASLGNLLGVIVTPAWLVLLAGGLSIDIDLVPVLQKLGLVVVAPLALGQVIQALLGDGLPTRVRKTLGKTNLGLLLGILYLSFATAFASGGDMGWWPVLIILPIAAGLHLVLLGLLWWASAARALALSRADRACALICGSQKTFALGLPLIALCFPGHPALPLIALPILIYHPLQLLLAGPLSLRLAGWVEEEP